MDFGTSVIGVTGVTGDAIIALSSVPIDRVTASQVVFQNNLVHRKRRMPADAVPVWELGKGA